MATRYFIALMFIQALCLINDYKIAATQKGHVDKYELTIKTQSNYTYQTTGL
jgi:hypothetical protein